MACKVNIKCPDTSNDARLQILQILNGLGSKCSRIYTKSKTEFVVCCFSGTDADVIFTVNCLTALKAVNCTPIMPMSLKAQRSILVRGCQDDIYDNSADDIKNELIDHNEWLTVTDVFKFPNAKLIKITCINQEIASRSLINGLKMFHLYVPPRDIQREEYFDIPICYKCYALNDHSAKECEKPAGYTVCSTCSSADHSFKNCLSLVKCCLNCDGPHSTLAYSCPNRKEIIKKLKSNKGSYASKLLKKSSVTTNVNPNVQNISPVPTVISDFPLNHWSSTSKTISTSILCMVVASAKEKETPGSFQDVLDTLMSANNVPRFNMGNVEAPNMCPHSTEILSCAVDGSGASFTAADLSGAPRVCPDDAGQTSVAEGTSGDEAGATHCPTDTVLCSNGTTLGPARTTLGPAGTTLGPAGTTLGAAGTTLGATRTTLGAAGTTTCVAGTTLGTAGTTLDAAGSILGAAGTIRGAGATRGAGTTRGKAGTSRPVAAAGGGTARGTAVTRGKKKEAVITIVKKKSAAKITTDNLVDMFNEGVIIFNGSLDNTQDECLELFINSDRFSSSELASITELKAKDFDNLKSSKQIFTGDRV
jgi:ribosomal protein L40E